MPNYIDFDQVYRRDAFVFLIIENSVNISKEVK